MAGALADSERTPLGARPDALGGRALVGVDGGHHEGGRIQPLVVLRVGRSAGDDLGDRLAGGLRRPPQDVQGLGHRLAAHQVDDPARLGRRNAHEARLRDRGRIFSRDTHQARPLLFAQALIAASPCGRP